MRSISLCHRFAPWCVDTLCHFVCIQELLKFSPNHCCLRWPAHAAASRRGKTSFDSLPRAISNLTLPTHNDKLHLLEKIYKTLVRILLPEELIDAHEPHQSQGIVNKSLKQPVLELDNGAVCCQCIKIH